MFSSFVVKIFIKIIEIILKYIAWTVFIKLRINLVWKTDFKEEMWKKLQKGRTGDGLEAGITLLYEWDYSGSRSHWSVKFMQGGSGK